MADEKILSSLNKNVEKIQKNVSKFGPKLPGGDEPDTTPDDQLSVLCAIAGTVFGKKFNGVEDILNKNPKDSLLSKVLYNITEIFDNKYFKKIEEIFKNNINQSLTNNLGNILKESFVSDEFKNTLLEILNNSNKEYDGSQTIEFTPNIDFNPITTKLDELFGNQNKNNFNQIIKSLTNNLRKMLKESFVSDEFKNTLLEILNNSNKEYDGSQTIEFTPNIDFNPITTKLDELISVQNQNDFSPIITKLDELIGVQNQNDFNSIIKPLTNNLSNILKESFVSDEFKNTLLEILNTSNKEYNASQTIILETDTNLVSLIDELTELLESQKLTDGDKVTESFKFINNLLNSLDEIKNNVNIDELTNFIYEINKIPGIDSSIKPRLKELSNILVNSDKNKDIKSIKEIYTDMKDINKLLKDIDITKSINQIVNNLKNINKLDTVEFDQKSIIDNLKNINKIFDKNDNKNDNKNNINIVSLLSKMKETFTYTEKDKSIFTGVKSFLSIIDTLAKIGEKKINMQYLITNINVLNNLLDINKGDVAKLITNIQELSGLIIKNKTPNNVLLIDTVIDLLLKVMSINPVKLLFAKLGLKALNNIIENELNQVLITLNEVAISSEKSKKESIVMLGSFIDSLLKLADIGLIQMFRIQLNFTLLSKFIVRGFSEIIESLNEVSGDIEKSEKIISNVKNFIDVLLHSLNIDDDKQSKIFESLDFLNSIIDEIEDFYGNLSKVNPVQIGILENINSTFVLFNIFLQSIPGYKELTINLSKVNLINDISKTLGEIIKNVNGVKLEDIQNATKNVEELSKLFDKLNNVGQRVDSFNFDAKNLKNLIKVLVDAKEKEPLIFAGIEILDQVTKKLKVIVESINTIPTIKEEVVKNLSTLISDFTKVVVVCGGLLLFAGIVMALVDTNNIFLFGITLTILVTAVTGTVLHFAKDIKESNIVLKDLALLILSAGITLALGSAIFYYLKWNDLLGFAVSLGLFIWSMTYIVIKTTKNVPAAFEGIKDFGIFIAICGTTLIFGSLLFHLIKMQDLAGFALVLGVFVLSMTYIGGIAGKLMEKSLPGILDFGIFIAICGTTLIFGSLLFNLIKMQDLAGFAFILGLFVFGSLTALFRSIALAGKIFGLGKGNPMDILKNSMRGIIDFGIFIAICGATLALGSAIYHFVDGKALVGFTVILGLFVFGMIGIATIASRFMKKSLKGIQDFGKLIAISGIILLFGGTFFTLFPGVKKGVFEFAVTLGLFMLMIGGALALTGQGLKKNKHIALEFALLVAICGGILLFAGYVLKDETISKNIWTFIGMTFVLVGGMAAIIWVLSKFKKQDLIQGGLALIGIVAIVGLMAIVLDKIVETTNKIQDVDKLHQGLLACAMAFGGMTVIVAIIYGIMAIIYGIMAIPGIKMIAGVGLAMVLGIAAAMLIVSESMLNVAKALDQLSKIKQFDGKVLLGNLSALMGIVTALAPFTLIAPTIKYTTNALMSLTKLMSEMAKAVKEYSSLKIPEYSGTKLIGYRKLESSDFVKAGNNIKLIITTLGDAVIQTYEKKPEMFETNLFGNSKFAKVTKSLKTLAPLISSIAKSVKDYADLKIADYGNGDLEYDQNGRPKIKRYKQLDKTDFENAASNIGYIITTLGDAIIQTYDKRPEMFETNLFGNSKFSKVTKSLKTLAPLISSIAKSVKDYADLKIADYGNGDLEYDQNGRPKIKRYKQLTKTDFEDAARHIGIIINTLGDGIIQCYHDNPDIYDEGTFTSGIFGKVVKSNMRLGDLISKISKSVQDFANLHMPTGYTVDKDGNMKPTGFRTMTPTDFENAAINIQKIITILGTPILRVAKDEKLFPLFEETSGFFGSSKSRVSLIIEGNLKLASLITKIGKAVQSIAQLKLPIYENGKLTGYELLKNKDITQIGTIIKNIIEALPKAVIEGYEKFPEELKIKDGEENKLLNNIKFSFESISSIIKNIASGISSYSSMKIADWSQGVDEHGNPKVYLTLNESTINTAGDNVKFILTSLGKAIEEVSKEKWFDKDYQNKLDSMNQTFDKINQLISQSAKTIQDVSNLRIIEKFDNNGNALGYLRMKKENFEEAAKNAVIVVTSVMKALYNIYQGKDEEGKPLLEGLTPESIQAMFDNENGKDSPFQKVINTSINLAGMISSVAEGVELFTKMDTGKLKEVAKPIGEILGAISNAVISTVRDPKNLEAFGAPDILLGLTKGDANKAPAMIAVNAIAGMVEPIGKLATIIGYYSANQFPIIKGYNSNGDPIYIFESLNSKSAKKNIEDALKAMVGALTSITKTDDFKTMQSSTFTNFISRFNDYVASLSSLIEVNDKAKNSGVDGYNNIIKGITKINNSVNGIKPDKSKNFKKFNNELDHFITTINKVNVDKVDKVTKFVKSMESLANKFGSLDKLVDAIAESLATELNRLSNEITNSKEVINKAETIQKNREKIIEKQINNVKTILSQSLKIEIGQITDNNPLTKTDKQSSSGGGGSKPKETKPETKSSNTTGPKSSNNDMTSQNNTDNKQNNSYTPFSSSPLSDNSGSSEQDIMTIFEEVLQRTQWKIDGSTIKHK